MSMFQALLIPGVDHLMLLEVEYLRRKPNAGNIRVMNLFSRKIKLAEMLDQAASKHSMIALIIQGVVINHMFKVPIEQFRSRKH